MEEKFKIGTPVRVNVDDENLKSHFSGGLYIVARYEREAIERDRPDMEVCLYSVTNRCYTYSHQDWLEDISDEVLTAMGKESTTR